MGEFQSRGGERGERSALWLYLTETWAAGCCCTQFAHGLSATSQRYGDETRQQQERISVLGQRRVDFGSATRRDSRLAAVTTHLSVGCHELLDAGPHQTGTACDHYHLLRPSISSVRLSHGLFCVSGACAVFGTSDMIWYVQSRSRMIDAALFYEMSDWCGKPQSGMSLPRLTVYMR